MKKKNEVSNSAPLLRMGDLTQPPNHVKRSILKRIEAIYLANGMAANYSHHQAMAKPDTTRPASLLGVFTNEKLSVQLMDRPPDAPVKPDEPMSGVWFVSNQRGKHWPESPTIEIQFPEAVESAFP